MYKCINKYIKTKKGEINMKKNDAKLKTISKISYDDLEKLYLENKLEEKEYTIRYIDNSYNKTNDIKMYGTLRYVEQEKRYIIEEIANDLYRAEQINKQTFDKILLEEKDDITKFEFKETSKKIIILEGWEQIEKK